MRTHFELVIFDADGVLVDTEPQSCRIWSSALSEIALHMTADEVGELFTGLSDADTLAIISKLLDKPLPPMFLDSVARRELDLFRRELQPIPGVIGVLDCIKTPTCVASSGTHEKLEVTLGATGLLDRFAGRIFSATEVERGKPAP
ncbi:MAG: HAD-superfamily hydrolase, subfamily variant 3, partial [Chloroflexi bacterium]|nr:HAD-superfamily hydrolase, subfamily variant 3 [Chloroflexota bacterium]